MGGEGDRPLRRVGVQDDLTGMFFCDGAVSPLSRILPPRRLKRRREGVFCETNRSCRWQGAPRDERDVSRPDWKTASFGRGSQRGCRVSADLPVQILLESKRTPLSYA